MTDLRKLIQGVLDKHLVTVTAEQGQVVPKGRQWVNGIGSLGSALEELYDEAYAAGFEDGKAEQQPKIDMLLTQLVEKTS